MVLKGHEISTRFEVALRPSRTPLLFFCRLT